MKKKILKIILIIVLICVLLFVIPFIYKLNIILKQNKMFNEFMESDNSKVVVKPLYTDGESEFSWTYLFKDGKNKWTSEFPDLEDGKNHTITMYSEGNLIFEVREEEKMFSIFGTDFDEDHKKMFPQNAIAIIELHHNYEETLLEKLKFWWGIVISNLSQENCQGKECYKIEIRDGKKDKTTYYIDKKSYFTTAFVHEYYVYNSKEDYQFYFETNCVKDEDVQMPDLTDYEQELNIYKEY